MGHPSSQLQPRRFCLRERLRSGPLGGYKHRELGHSGAVCLEQRLAVDSGRPAGRGRKGTVLLRLPKAVGNRFSWTAPARQQRSVWIWDTHWSPQAHGWCGSSGEFGAAEGSGGVAFGP